MERGREAGVCLLLWSTYYCNDDFMRHSPEYFGQCTKIDELEKPLEIAKSKKASAILLRGQGV